ncbi:protein of unknown function [Burkholderia multivorans]
MAGARLVESGIADLYLKIHVYVFKRRAKRGKARRRPQEHVHQHRSECRTGHISDSCRFRGPFAGTDC